MAGVSIRYEFDDRAVRDALQRLADAAGDLEPAFADIGEYLLNSIQERSSRHEAPDGTPWEPLSPGYKARKKRNADKILVLDDHLIGELAYQADSNSVQVGTAMIYGATHQFGDPGRNIPTRPFLGVSTDDEAEILAILQDHLVNALS